jgi:prepilin-type N-terminal cleavage/methylation domain-containing protein
VRLRRGGAGFTLVEVLISLAIFAVGALGALSMILSISTLNANSAQTTESDEVANWLIEQFEVRPANDASIVSDGVEVPASAALLKSVSSATISIPDIVAAGHSTQAAVRYQVRWRSDLATGAGANMRHWRVRVRWQKNREARTLDAGQTGYVDCYDATTFSSGACMSTEYHTYRKVS